MVLGAPNFEDGHGLVAKFHRANVNLSTFRVDQLLDDVTVPAGTLIVNAQNWVLVHQLHARFHHAVQLVTHFRVASLDGVEIQARVRFVFAAGFRGRSTAAHADSIRRTTDFNDQHAQIAFLFFQVGVIDLTETGGKHDWLNIFASFAVR